MPSYDDYYNILGVDRNASASNIKNAYRKLVKRCHPDILGPNASPKQKKDAEERFKRIQKAYEIIYPGAQRRERERQNIGQREQEEQIRQEEQRRRQQEEQIRQEEQRRRQQEEQIRQEEQRRRQQDEQIRQRRKERIAKIYRYKVRYMSVIFVTVLLVVVYMLGNVSMTDSSETLRTPFPINKTYDQNNKVVTENELDNKNVIEPIVISKELSNISISNITSVSIPKIDDISKNTSMVNTYLDIIEVMNPGKVDKLTDMTLKEGESRMISDWRLSVISINTSGVRVLLFKGNNLIDDKIVKEGDLLNDKSFSMRLASFSSYYKIVTFTDIRLSH